MVVAPLVRHPTEEETDVNLKRLVHQAEEKALPPSRPNYRTHVLTAPFCAAAAPSKSTTVSAMKYVLVPTAQPSIVPSTRTARRRLLWSSSTAHARTLSPTLLAPTDCFFATFLDSTGAELNCSSSPLADTAVGAACCRGALCSLTS